MFIYFFYSFIHSFIHSFIYSFSNFSNLFTAGIISNYVRLILILFKKSCKQINHNFLVSINLNKIYACINQNIGSCKHPIQHKSPYKLSTRESVNIYIYIYD